MDGFDPDAFISANQAAPAAQVPVKAAASPGVDSSGFDPDAFIEDAQQEHYGTGTQQAIAGLEGVAKGIAGPLAPLAEKAIGIKEEDIRGRAEANPITSGVAQAGGLGLGLLTGTGEGALMEAVGKGAAELAGLAEPVSYAAKVGSAAVQQAAEMAVLQSGDEASKMILHDPSASADTALANIGLASALGGAGGALIAGAVSPLWKATAGPKVEEFLSGLTSHLNGSSQVVMPEAVSTAFKELGIEPHELIKGAMSGDPKFIQAFNELRESQHPEVLNAIKSLQPQVSEALASNLGVPLSELAHYSHAAAGDQIFDSFSKELEEKYGPIAKALEKRDAEAATIAIPDEVRRDFGGRLVEQGMKEVGTDSPFYKIYEDMAQRVMAKENIGGLDKLKTELMNSAKSMSSDTNAKIAYHDVRNMISEFQEQQISRQARNLENEGIIGGKQAGADLLNERAETNRQYAQLRKTMNDLTTHLGIGEFKGVGTLMSKMGEKLSPEDIARKFSPRGNVESIPFLRQNFPETFEHVKRAEMEKFLSPAVKTEAGEHVLDVKKLSGLVEKSMKGSPEYTEFALPQGALGKIQAAKTIMDSMPGIKSSGTAGWMGKIYKHVPASATGAIGFLMGHNPVASALLGELAMKLGKDAPDAIKLGLLRQLSSDQPIKAEGFKAMVDFIHNTIKGENMLSKASSAVFKSGAQVLTDKSMPNQADRDKLDKIVSKIQDQPSSLEQRLSQDETGHYLPQHQTAMAQSTSTAIQYLQSLKPKAFQPSPLDRPIEPSRMEQARYSRALDIAQSPAIVFQHIKDGTLQASDIQDLHSMYPALYAKMVQKLSNDTTNHSSNGEAVPYRTRTALSLFLGQPLDSTMQPQNIMAAQPQPQAPPPQNQGKQGKGSPKALGKSNKTYMTPLQAAQNHHSDRE